MLIISPRSYVTAAFDLVFPTLLEYVFMKFSSQSELSPNSNWWVEVVCNEKQKKYIFGNDEERQDIRDRIEEQNIPEHAIALSDYFDEYSLFKMVSKSYGAEKYFEEEDRKIFKKLLEIRNEWAHPDYAHTSTYDADKPKRVWAESAINYIRYAIHYLKKVYIVKDFIEDMNIEKYLSILFFRMKCDWIDETKLRPHNELIEWLYKEVVEPAVDDISPVSDEMRNRINGSFNEMIDYANATSERSESSASRHVVDFYWNAIKSKSNVHDDMKSYSKSIKTFEDVVEHFTKYCYGV